MAKIDFYFDFFSPFSYLASFRIRELAERHRAPIIYHMVDNQVIKRGAGTTGPPNHSLPPKYRYLRIDLARWARRYGISLTSPESVAGVSHEVVGQIGRGFLVAKHRGTDTAYLRFAYDRLWGENPDVSEQTLRELAPVAGVEISEFMRAIDSAEILREADRENAGAQERGVFGVPTFIVNDQIFWGNDRIDMLDEYLVDPSRTAKI
ncbi:MAG: 2-hydroxychromene-2-carboxylate isomerase [Candidatus Binataceae bacterium]